MFIEYLLATGRHIYLLTVGAVGFALTLVSIGVPGALRLVGPFLLGAGVFGAQFRAWRDMRAARDQAHVNRDEMHRELENIRLARSLIVGPVQFTNFLGPALSPVSAAVQVGLQLRNFGQNIVGYQVEHMHVVIAGKTLTHPHYENLGTEVIPPQSTTDFRYPSIPDLDITQPLDGTVDITLAYGHPDLGMSRRLHESRTFTLMALVGNPSNNIGGSLVNNHVQWTVSESSDVEIPPKRGGELENQPVKGSR